MLGLSRVWLQNFRTQKITDRLQLVMAKKEVEFDHIAIDMNGLVGAAMRMAKNCPTEARRNSEVSRHVKQSLQNLLKKFHPKKSLLIAMDGAEPVWKAARTRSATMTKKVETRLMRLPGSSMMHAIEDKVLKMMPESRLCPSEVVFSGTSVAGPVEQKFSAWALDVADREATRQSDTLCFIGGTELFLNTIGLTPFYNIVSVVQNNADFKQLTMHDAIDWLGLDEALKRGDHAALARLRTDAVFLFGLCNGFSATDVGGVPGIQFADVMARYIDLAQHGTGDFALFKEGGESGELQLHAKALADVLAGARVASAAAAQQQQHQASLSSVSVRSVDRHVHNYLQLLLQSHTLLCCGQVPNPFLGLEAADASALQAAPSLGAIVAYLSNLDRDAVLTAARPNPVPQHATAHGLTAAEFTLLAQSQAPSVLSLVASFVGMQPKPDVGKKITSASDLAEALGIIREILMFANPSKPHKSLCFSPSYLWKQNQRTKLWAFHYVDLGARSAKNATRQKRNAESTSISFSVSNDGPVVWDPTERAWSSIHSFPYGSDLSGPPPARLNVLTWNVMFDRYSGMPTPLGMPGIDWCSPKRYPVLAKLIKGIDADVVAMQEVEPQFWEYLAALPWVQENYIFTCNVTGPAINPWGVLMMVHKRQKIQGITHVNVPAFSGHMSLMPIVTLKMAHAPVAVGSVHLLAPFTKSHENVRTAQDTVLRQRMAKSFLPESIVCGDFNDWPTSEFTMPAESGYVDAWPILKPGDPGKTMDETNEFCKLKIEEIFFGRSDKFFVRSRKLQPAQASLVGTKSVNQENGDNKAPGYLFPSDHYGVQMLFVVK